MTTFHHCVDNATVTLRAGFSTRMPFNNFRCTNQPINACVTVSRLSQCATFCLSKPDCVSFNFGKITDISNSFYCETTSFANIVANLTAQAKTDWS